MNPTDQPTDPTNDEPVPPRISQQTALVIVCAVWLVYVAVLVTTLLVLGPQ